MPKIITLAKTKELLGITDGDQDTKINRYIPIIDAKVKMMTNNRYNTQLFGNTTDSVTAVELFSIQNNQFGLWRFPRSRGLNFNQNQAGINNPWLIDDLEEYLEVGTLISGDGIPADTYIDEVYFNGGQVTLDSVIYTTPTIVLSNAATATSDNAQIFTSFNIGLQTTVAKGIAWLIDEENETIPEAGLLSKSIGPTRKSWSVSQSQIDGRFGMPVWFVKSFPVYMSGH